MTGTCITQVRRRSKNSTIKEGIHLYIADRVQKTREEMILDVVDELMDRYGLNREHDSIDR